MKTLIVKSLFIGIVILGCLRPIMNAQLTSVLGPLIYLVPDTRVFSDSYFFVKPQISLTDINDKRISFVLDYKTAKPLIFSNSYARHQYRLINFAVTRPHFLKPQLVERILRVSICRATSLSNHFNLADLKSIEIFFEKSKDIGLPKDLYKVDCLL